MTGAHQGCHRHRGGTPIAAFSADPAGFDPVRGPSGLSHVVIEQVYSTLILLDARQATGGDKRGRQSAAIKVMWREAYPCVDLRVDEHRHPVAELRRMFEVARQQYLPFIVGMPTRGNLLGNLPDEVGAMLLTPPP